MARVTGLEPATSGVTGQHSNQLNYRSFPQNWHVFTLRCPQNLAGEAGFEPAHTGIKARGLRPLGDSPSKVAGLTGIEPATSDVTDRYLNQLDHNPTVWYPKPVSNQ